MIKINGETKLIGFFGSTYKTSKMYALYNSAFGALKLNYAYVPFIVNDLRKAVDGIRNLSIAGVGVTIPYKIEIMKYLDALDEDAQRIGAVNAVINKNGRLIGANTDGKGGILALKEHTIISGKNVLLLGTGGVGRSLAFALKDEGGKLTIANRTIKNAQELSKATGANCASLDDLEDLVNKADILINATSVGMAPQEKESLINQSWLRPGLIIQEVVSRPQETTLVKDTKRAGCTAILGERMLLWQAVLKFKLFTGVEAPLKVMEKAMSGN